MAFDLLVSEIVEQESQAGDPLLARRRLELLANISVLAANGAILSVARALVAEGAMPSKALTDAVHTRLRPCTRAIIC
jgi:hypothetical protein